MTLVMSLLSCQPKEYLRIDWKEIESLQRKSANERTACWNFRGIPPKDQVNGPWKFSDDTEEFSDFFIHMSKAESRLPINPSKRGQCHHQEGDLLSAILLRKF